MSGPNAPPRSGPQMPVRPPLNAATEKPMGADRFPQTAPTLPRPVPRVSHTGPSLEPAPFAPRDAPIPPTNTLSPERQALADAMRARGMVQTGPTQAQNFEAGKRMLARAMLGITDQPEAQPAPRPNYAAGQPGTARELNVTYEPDPSVKFDKKGRPKEGTQQKVNKEAKGHSARLYETLGIDESMGKSGVQPEINKLIKKAKETPWLLTRAEDKILSNLNERGGRSIEPAAVDERFREYEKERQASQQEEDIKAYEKTAKGREKRYSAEEKKAAREEAKKAKEEAATKAYSGPDPAQAKVESYIEQMGAPLWQGINLPTQVDVTNGAATPAQFQKQFPYYEPPPPDTPADTGADEEDDN